MPLSPELKQQLDELVQSHPVVLFMKGNRAAPQCGFSASVVEVLDRLLDEYETVDVLSRPDVRDGIKEYSDWPTIPQLYIRGEFVGGADIVKQLSESGELEETLAFAAGAAAEVPLPSVTVTPAAKAQIEVAGKEDPDGPHLHLEVSPLYEHALYFDKPGPRDLEVNVDGLRIYLDPKSAARADGIVIDFVDTDSGAGFKIDNPNKDRPAEPAEAPQVSSSVEGGPQLAPPKLPELEVTEPALAQFEAALEQERASASDAEAFGVRVVARRMGATKVDYELAIIAEGEKKDADLVLEQAGVRYYMDPLSARNLDGARIDFVDSDEGSGFKFENPRLKEGWQNPVAGRFQQVLDDEINPSVAAHGGYVQLLDLAEDTAFVLMGGGCQGCSSAAVTLQGGIAERMKAAVPEVRHIIDTTDHAAGTNPYFKG